MIIGSKKILSIKNTYLNTRIGSMILLIIQFPISQFFIEIFKTRVKSFFDFAIRYSLKSMKMSYNIMCNSPFK